MTQPPDNLSPDHPDVTAFALDALTDPERRAAVARAVEADPELQAEVEAMRQAAGLAGQALRGDPSPENRDRDVAASLMEAAMAEKKSARPEPLRFPAWLRHPVTGLAAMALFGLGLFFLMQEPLDLAPDPERPQPASFETAPPPPSAPEPAAPQAAPEPTATIETRAMPQRDASASAPAPSPVINLSVDAAALADADAALPEVHLDASASPTPAEAPAGPWADQGEANDHAFNRVPTQTAGEAEPSRREAPARLLRPLPPTSIEADLEAIRLSQVVVDAPPEAAAAQVNLQLLHAQQHQQARGLADAWTVEIVEPADGQPARQAQPTRVQLRLTETTGRAAIEALAEQLEAEVTIQPGKVQLVRRSGEE
ncbi:MAG: hypothetical protein ACFE0O_14380 [Opitutales bacterium]